MRFFLEFKCIKDFKKIRMIFYWCRFIFSYCDVFQKCREVDPAGPLATLRRLLLSEESIESFKKWVLSNWFVVALIISAIISLLVCTIVIEF